MLDVILCGRCVGGCRGVTEQATVRRVRGLIDSSLSRLLSRARGCGAYLVLPAGAGDPNKGLAREGEEGVPSLNLNIVSLLKIWFERNRRRLVVGGQWS